MKLIIGNRNYSSWSLRPWLLLSVNGIPFEEVRIALYEPGASGTIAEYTDAGKVPVLHDRDLVVWDSLAICEYVSEQHLGGAGWPADVNARAEARSCSAEMHSGFAELRAGLPMNCRASGRRVEITPAMTAEIERIDAIWAGLRHRFAERGPWLFGDFSIADCMFAPVVSRFHTYGVAVSGVSSAYMAQVLGNRDVKQWYRLAAEESETIGMYEVGLQHESGKPAHGSDPAGIGMAQP